MALLVHVDDQQEDLPIDISSILSLVQAVLELEGAAADEVSVTFLPKGLMGRLHKEFFNDPSPTDCMSFPIDNDTDSGYRVLGDVVVCPMVAREYCEEHGGEIYEEVSLYLVHGILHLLGYDDIEPTDRLKMRAAERRHLKHLKKLELLIKTGR